MAHHSFVPPFVKHRGWLMPLGITIFTISTFGLLQPLAAGASTVTEQLNQSTSDFNFLLDQEVETLNTTLSDASISVLDVNTLFSDVLPSEFANTSQSCIQGPLLAPFVAPTSICSEPETFVFFDNIHPTTAVHSRIADIAIDALPQTVIDQTNKLIIFGDSLSDVNNLFGFSGGILPPATAPAGPLTGQPLYTSGAFTNGRVWWQYLTEQLALTDPVAYYENALTGTFPASVPNEGLNFALSGSTTGVDNAGNAQNPPFPFDLPGVEDQIATFDLLLGGEGADPDALYVIWAGANNFLGAFVPEDPTNPFAPFTDFTLEPTQPVDDISVAINTLYDRGARNFLVGNLYNLGETPLGQELELINPPVAVPEPDTLAGTVTVLGLFWGCRKFYKRKG